jgi:hypothetical protein
MLFSSSGSTVQVNGEYENTGERQLAGGQGSYYLQNICLRMGLIATVCLATAEVTVNTLQLC